MKVTHHFPDKEKIASALKNYKKLKDEAFATAEDKKNPDMEYISDCCLDVFFCKAYLNNDEEHIALRDFSDALTALLMFALHPGETVICKWEGKKKEFTPDNKKYFISPHIWNMAFFATVLSEDDFNMDALMTMDIDKIIAVSGKKKTYAYSMAIALQAFYSKQNVYPQLLTKALEENMAVAKSDPNYEKALDLDGPPLELIYLFLTKSNEQFNDKLLDALEWHKKHCIKSGKENAGDNTGLISLPLCAVIKLAKQIKHFTIAHASDYIPKDLTGM